MHQEAEMLENNKHSSKRGFAAMDQEKQRAIARKGGESVPAGQRSFSRNHQLAADAGRKGGQSVPAQARSFAKNHQLAAEAGRKGGRSRGQAAVRDRDDGSLDPARETEAGANRH
jgi:uncharacterized protein